MVISDCKEVPIILKAVLKCVSMELGELYVMISGEVQMQMWSVDSLDSEILVYIYNIIVVSCCSSISFTLLQWMKYLIF